MDYRLIENGGETTVILQGKITFLDHLGFKSIISALKNATAWKRLVLDMKEVEFADSAALGSLLLLKDEASKKGVALVVRNLRGQLKKMFELSRFYEIFTIEEIE